MDKTTARRIVSQRFKAAFDPKRCRDFINELCNGFDESKKQTMQVPDAFAPHVASCLRLGTYESPDGELADVLVVLLTQSFKLERTRTALRDFVAHKLKRGDNSKEAGLVAFVAPDARRDRTHRNRPGPGARPSRRARRHGVALTLPHSQSNPWRQSAPCASNTAGSGGFR